MIVILGGGISGLALAHELDRRGRDFLLLESADRTGGVIRSDVVDGHVLDRGPQRTRLVADVKRVIDELELTREVVTAPTGLPLYVYRDGALRPVPFSAAAFLTGDILPWHARLRLLLEPLTGGAQHDETVAEFFTRKLGRHAYESLAGPLYGGLYASDPADMVVGSSLRHVLDELRVGRSLLLTLLRRGGRVSPPPAISFRNGMETLPRALHRRHSDRIRTGVVIEEVRADGPGFVVATATGGIRADQIVVTTPAGAAAALLRTVAPAAADAARALVYNPLAVVHLRTESELHGLGYQVSLAEALVTRGVTFNGSLFDRDGVCTAWLGGARHPWVADRSDQELGELAVKEFETVTGAGAEVLQVAHVRMPAWDRSWTALDGLHLPTGIHLHTNWTGRPGLPGRFTASRRLADELTNER